MPTVISKAPYESGAFPTRSVLMETRPRLSRHRRVRNSSSAPGRPSISTRWVTIGERSTTPRSSTLTAIGIRSGPPMNDPNMLSSRRVMRSCAISDRAVVFMPNSTTRPAGRTTLRTVASCEPTASTAMSAPMPSVISRTSLATSALPRIERLLGAQRPRKLGPWAAGSTVITRAPAAANRAVNISPAGPAPSTTAVSPGNALASLTPLATVESGSAKTATSAGT